MLCKWHFISNITRDALMYVYQFMNTHVYIQVAAFQIQAPFSTKSLVNWILKLKWNNEWNNMTVESFM